MALEPPFHCKENKMSFGHFAHKVIAPISKSLMVVFPAAGAFFGVHAASSALGAVALGAAGLAAGAVAAVVPGVVLVLCVMTHAPEEGGRGSDKNRFVKPHPMFPARRNILKRIFSFRSKNGKRANNPADPKQDNPPRPPSA